MKKILVIFTIIAIALLIAPFSYSVNAEAKLEINTYYPNDVMEYANLTNVSNVTTNDNYIAYTTNNVINIFNKKDRSINQIENIDNILKIKFCYEKLLVAGNNTINIIDPITLNVTPISNITYPSNSPINFYFNDTTVQIGIIDTTLQIHSFDISNKEIILNSYILKSNTTLHTSEHTPYALTIINNKCYILSMNNEINSPNPTHLCVINTLTGDTIEENGFKKATLIETFIHNNVEYIATFVADSNLFILDEHLNEVSKISVSHESESNSTITIINDDGSTKVKNSTFPIYTVKSLEIYQNQLILCDIAYKTICSFNLSTTTDDLLDITSDKVLICSNSSDIGRFDNISNIFTQDEKIYISDTDNNRIQILDNLNTTILKTPNTIKPSNLVADKFGKIFYISTDNKNVLNSIDISNSQYIEKSIDEFNSTNLGEIIQLEIDNNDKLYLLDKTNNALHLYSTNLEYFKTLNLPSVNENAQLVFVKDINELILYNDNKLYIVNTIDFSRSIISDSLIGYYKITAGLSSIYALSNDNKKITNISIQDNSFKIKEDILNEYFDLYNTLTLNNSTNTMYCFNKEKQCIEYFSLNQDIKLPSNEDISTSTPLNQNTQPIALQSINKSAIYEYPYNLGKCYHLNTKINCIAIGKINNYYKVLISKDNQLATAYIHINEVNKINNEIDEKSVIVTHNTIPVYKYPTLLEFKGKAVTINNLNRNEIITLTSHFPISIDDKDFYLYINNNTYGYIFSADVVLNTGNHITYLHNENAKVKCFDSNKINVYDKDYTTIISTLDNEYRIYVNNYDKNSKYTKIIFKDDNLKEVEGYILTEYIKMDKLDSNQIILIAIIAFSIIILLGIIISYIIIKKKK